jgi:carbonic anhydrase/acetyltransferase-like protein (isoleucine patch superfamily)
MTIYKIKNKGPQLSEGLFIADSADVIGDVIFGADASVWFGCVVRGDVNQIKIGKETNIQDLSILHVTAEHPLTIGAGVTVGHKVTLHGCTIGNNCLIGMGAIILDGVTVGENSLVAAGALLTPGKSYPPNSLIVGSPAEVKRDLLPAEIQKYGNHFKHYIETKNDYLSGLIKL